MNKNLKHICPLCGGSNECAWPRNESCGTQCWCQDVVINPEAVLRAQELPNNGCCICKKCATATLDSGIQQVKAKLYGTECCHLCKEAVDVIQKAGGTAVNVDISEDDHLFEKYSTRIPVLARIDNDAELDWPFDAVSVSRFLM